MNKITRDIALLLGVSAHKAEAIQDEIEQWYNLDYSECTTREFNAIVRAAYKGMEDKSCAS